MSEGSKRRKRRERQPMSERARSRWMVGLGIAAMIGTVLVIVGWNVMFTKYYKLSRKARLVSELTVGYWLLLSIGDVVLVLVFVALILFMVAIIRKERLVRRQNTFVDSVTHELKSPLASLQLALDTLELRDPPPEMRERFLKMMKDDVRRLSSFVETVLEAGRLAHETGPLALEPVDVHAIAQDCVRRVSRQHGLPPGAITLDDRRSGDDDAPERGPVRSDTRALETILVNLLDNAAKYSAAGDEAAPIRIRLELERDDETLVMRVADEGIGIAPGRLGRVFERFYRIEGERRVRGSGLGLYICKALVSRLGGRVWAESEGAGRGTTFSVRLPLMEDAA